MMAARLAPMTIVNPSPRSKTRIGLAYACRMSSSLTPVLACALRDDRIVAHISKLACSTTHRQDARRACLMTRNRRAPSRSTRSTGNPGPHVEDRDLLGLVRHEPLSLQITARFALKSDRVERERPDPDFSGSGPYSLAGVT